MTATLSVEVEPAAFEVARADVAFVLFFADERPLRGSAGRADWRLCGHLSRLIVEGRLSGGPGEAALLPTAGGLRAPLLVALGAGPRNAFDEAAWQRASEDVARRAIGLRARSIALALPAAEPGRLGLRQRVEALLAGAAQALAERPADLLLRVVATGDEVQRARDLLSGTRGRDLPPAVSLRVLTADRRREAARTPRRDTVRPS